MFRGHILKALLIGQVKFRALRSTRSCRKVVNYSFNKTPGCLAFIHYHKYALCSYVKRTKSSTFYYIVLIYDFLNSEYFYISNIFIEITTDSIYIKKYIIPSKIHVYINSKITAETFHYTNQIPKHFSLYCDVEKTLFHIFIQYKR